MKKQNVKIIQSVSRAIEIIRCFDNNEELGVTDISKILNLHKSTAFGLISTLEAYNLLEKNKYTGKYKLGIELFRLGTKVNSNLRNISTPYLEKLLKRYEETVNLVVRDGNFAMYLEKIESPHSMRICTKVGQRLPLYSTAVGKTILASLSKEETEDILNTSEIKKYTEKTISDKEQLFEHINMIREKGYAEDFEELEEGLTCVAAPIINHTKKAIAAISISGPTSRMNKELRLEIGRTLVKVTKEISEKLGFINI
ncbi:IclR family transcriptional regulator [Maledivibacter halophilus]|nr:IclR family transcriptional regulator [Maledivibacter halophilus]